MQIIIEVSGGCVAGVYHKRKTEQDRIPDVFVVDLDAGEVGEEVSAAEQLVEPLKDASDETKALFS